MLYEPSQDFDKKIDQKISACIAAKFSRELAEVAKQIQQITPQHVQLQPVYNSVNFPSSSTFAPQHPGFASVTVLSKPAGMGVRWASTEVESRNQSLRGCGPELYI